MNHIISQPLPMRVKVKAAKLKDVDSLLKNNFCDPWHENEALKFYKDIIDSESDIAEDAAEESDTVEHGDEDDELDLRV
ncbi:hypothetical protein PR048_008577 [Dryococelus australis]|uniref:Uncharacterized protein n=1 Tax=Dryococelus australis TaxID=614101 RepID=A0ABQ9HXI5_9NEOP|nr:hypothetical protein PR048_008577 [Dryococelus australis]